MILLLWTATAVVGTVYSALATARYFMAWRHLRDGPDGLQAVLLGVTFGRLRTEAGRLIAEVGLLSLGAVTLASWLDQGAVREIQVSYPVFVLFLVNWLLAANALLDASVYRLEEQYMRSHPDA